MTTTKLYNLLLKSSDYNPYVGNLSKKDNIISAIELAKLLKSFADSGQTAEAMDVESKQYTEVINKLNKTLNKIKNVRRKS